MLPVSSAGTNFQIVVWIGKLYAVIAVTTPIGSQRMMLAATRFPATTSRRGRGVCSVSGKLR